MQLLSRLAVRLLTVVLGLAFAVGVCPNSLAQSPHEGAAYYSALELEADCASSLIDRKQYCRTLLMGVLGTLLYLDHSDQMSGVLCLPAMSAETIRTHFLSFAIDHKREIQDMLAAAAVASTLYEKYPCPKEVTRRASAAAEAVKALEQAAGPKR